MNELFRRLKAEADEELNSGPGIRPMRRTRAYIQWLEERVVFGAGDQLASTARAFGYGLLFGALAAGALIYILR
jgi:hypothetical protein